MKSIIKLILSLAIWLLCFGSAMAAPKPPGGGGPPPCWPLPCSVPIDGGVGLLLAAGAALGAKKIMDYRNKNL
jgi:hypothetical protein